MSKRHTVTLHNVITVYNDMFDHMDGVMRALAKKMTQWMEDLFFAVKCARQKLSKYYMEVTPMTGMLLITGHILDPFRMLRSFRKWDTGMDINPEDETFYTTQYQEAFLRYVENEYCMKHRRLPVVKSDNTLNNILSSFEMACRSGQSSYDPYNLSSDDDKYLMPTNVAETTPGLSVCAARLLTAARLYFNSPPELPQTWGQIDPNLNDYHSDPMAISGTFWLPDITDWWWHQEETHSRPLRSGSFRPNVVAVWSGLRAWGSGEALAATGLYYSLFLSFFLSFFLVLFDFLSPFICQRGRRVAGGELRHLAGSPGGGGDIRVLSYSN